MDDAEHRKGATAPAVEAQGDREGIPPAADEHLLAGRPVVYLDEDLGGICVREWPDGSRHHVELVRAEEPVVIGPVPRRRVHYPHYYLAADLGGMPVRETKDGTRYRVELRPGRRPLIREKVARRPAE